jgi:hypothetical protein
MVTIDPELQSWILPLKQEEYGELEKSILEDGCRDALVVWNDTIIDGHNRYAICMAHDIPFKVVDKSFENKDSVKFWMISNQIARRNLDSIQRIALVMKGEALIAQRAKEKQLASLKQGDKMPDLVNLPERENKIDTRKEVAAQAKVSEKTYAKGKEVLLKRPEAMNKIISGETSIHKEYTEIKKEEKLEERRQELAQKTTDAQKLPDTITLYHGDFLKEYEKLGKESVDCIITDPPYVNEWLDNYAGFAKASEYVLKPGGFLITYIGHIHMDKILAQMTPYLEYYWIVMLKHAGTNAAVHSRSVQCGMKPILIFNKSPRLKPKRYFNDVIMGTGKEKDAHEWQQGEEELRQLFEPFTDPGDLVLDPFMGSGTTIAMAKKLNRRAIGFDIDGMNVAITNRRVS